MNMEKQTKQDKEIKAMAEIAEQNVRIIMESFNKNSKK